MAFLQLNIPQHRPGQSEIGTPLPTLFGEQLQTDNDVGAGFCRPGEPDLGLCTINHVCSTICDYIDAAARSLP